MPKRRSTIRPASPHPRVPVWLLAAAAGLLAVSGVGRPWIKAYADGWHGPPFEGSPLEFWRRHREQLGFPPSPGQAGTPPRARKKKLPEIDDFDAAKKRYEALLKRFRSERDPRRKKALREEAALLGEALRAYGLTGGGKKPGALRRQAFIQQALRAMAYTNRYNLSRAEFGWVLRNRKRFLDELVQIMREIGPEAAPRLWEHLRGEIVYYGEGKQGRAQVKTEVKRIEKRIRELRAQQRQVREKALWESLEQHIKHWQNVLRQTRSSAAGQAPGRGAPLPGLRAQRSLLLKKSLKEQYAGGLPYDRLGFLISDDYIETLSRALVAIGLPGLEAWLPGVWDANPAVRRHVLKMLRALGRPAVAKLIEALKRERSAAKRLRLAQALADLTGERAEVDVAKWEAWWKEHRPLKIPKKIEPPPPLPPAAAKPEKAEGGGEIIIGPRP